LSGIFISYRRQDSAPYAGRLYDRLSEVFGPDNVFMDVDDIDPGADFASLIEQKVTSCDALVAVIGRNWPASGEAQRSRLDDPHDFVRLELELALRRNVLVIPVLVEGALMPAANDIPAGLHEFTQRQAVELSDRDFNHGFEKLLNALETVPALSAAKPREKGTESRVSTQPGRLSRNFLTAVLLLALGLGVYWFFSDRSGQNISIAGRWRGFVSYSWGASYNEEFRFEPQGSRLLGTASFLGYDRAIEEGRIDRDQITFKVRFDQVSGGSTSTHVNRYTGKIALHSIDFVLEDDRGNLPVRFNATRSD
jgi:hypothetical protein